MKASLCMPQVKSPYPAYSYVEIWSSKSYSAILQPPQQFSVTDKKNIILVDLVPKWLADCGECPCLNLK